MKHQVLAAIVLVGCSSSDDPASPPSDAEAEVASDVATDSVVPGPDTASDTPATGIGLSAKHPRDEGMAADPAVLFYSDFEKDLAGFTDYTKDPARIAVVTDPAIAHGGSK